jgi:hypothetical protein
MAMSIGDFSKQQAGLENGEIMGNRAGWSEALKIAQIHGNYSEFNGVVTRVYSEKYCRKALKYWNSKGLSNTKDFGGQL